MELLYGNLSGRPLDFTPTVTLIKELNNRIKLFLIKRALSQSTFVSSVPS